jgi:hypothetical protein
MNCIHLIVPLQTNSHIFFSKETTIMMILDNCKRHYLNENTKRILIFYDLVPFSLVTAS